MAILQQDDKLLQDDQNQQGQSSQQQPQRLGGGESATVSAGGANTAGVGNGGTGSWTNIQSYLGANKGDTGTADYVQNKIGGQFNQEKTDLEKSANDTKTQAQAQSQKIVDTKNNADNLLNEATKTYDWSKSAQNYGQAGDQIRSGLYDQYSGPQSFAYGLGDKTQNYGTALNNADAFKQFLNGTYQERAGSSMSSGQLALQRQLDTTNDPLAAKKKDLASQYTGLQDTVNSTVKDADAYLVNAQRDYRNAQTDLGDYLRKNMNDTYSSEAQAEADARKQYGSDFSGSSVIPYTTGSSNGVENWENMTPQAVQQRLNQISAVSPAYLALPQYARSNDALNQWLAAQDEKYANVGDDQKKRYNALEDFLNGTDSRMSQGFKVRG